MMKLLLTVMEPSQWLYESGAVLVAPDGGLVADSADNTVERLGALAEHRGYVLLDGATGVERRRKWSAAAKAEIVAESLVEGAIVSEVARRHGLSPQQLFSWPARLRDAVRGSDSRHGPPD